MISNQILQNTIEGLKGISRIDFCVLDTEGKALATTFEDTWNYESAVLSFVESPADSQVIQGCQFFKIFDEQQLEYVLLAGGESEDVYMLGKIAAFQVQSLLVAYKAVSYTHLDVYKRQLCGNDKSKGKTHSDGSVQRCTDKAGNTFHKGKNSISSI